MLVLVSSFLISGGSEPTYGISNKIQQLCYTGDYEYLDATGNHLITDVAEQYNFLVTSYNAAVNAIKSYNPTISLENLHEHVAQGQGYQKMIALESCFQTNGINPDSISPMNPVLSQVVAVPEFGSLAGMVVVISIIGVVIVSSRFRFNL